MNDSQHIETNPAILLGKPVIKGTRIPVEIILDKLAAGQSEEELLSDYPRLTHEGIQAALALAAEAVREWKLYSLDS